MSKKWSYERLGVWGISLLITIAAVYSYKLFSLLLPLLTFVVVWYQGGIKNIPLKASPPFVLISLLIGLGGLSLFWTENTEAAVKTFVSLMFTLLFAYLLIACLMKATPDLISKAYSVLKISGALIMVLIIFQAYIDTFHVVVWKGLGKVPLMIKPAGSILGLTSFVGCAFLWTYNKKFLSISVFLIILPLVYLTLCKTALYGLLLALSIFILSYAFPFWTTRISMVASYTFLVTSPVLYAYFFIPSKIVDSPYLGWILNRSFFHRFLAWEFYSNKFFEKPLLGWGLESSRSVYTESMLAEGYGNTLHPHNNSLQAYAELGVMGGVLYALFFASLFWLVEKNLKDRLSVAVCNATLAFGFVTAEVTHNLWRNYWLSLAALMIGMIILFLKSREAQLHGAVDRSKQSLSHKKG